MRRNLPWWRPTVGTLTPHHPPARSVRDLYAEADFVTTMRGPRVSIVTPSLNQARYLPLALDSVRDQRYEPLEHIVVDGGSTDGSADMIAQRSSSLTWWVSEPDGGQASALNKGFKHATGEILAYLNADDCLLPGCLRSVVSYFAANPEVDVLYGNRILIDENDRIIGSWILPPHTRAAFAWFDFVPQESMFWRASAWHRVGSQFDDSFHYALDWELLSRFARSGGRFAHSPRFLAGFRVHPKQKTHYVKDHQSTAEASRVLAAMHDRSVSRRERIVRSIPFLLSQRAEECVRCRDYLDLLHPLTSGNPND